MRPARALYIAAAVTLLATVVAAPQASAAAAAGQFQVASNGVPDVAAGLDKGRLHDKAYLEALSNTSEKVAAAKARLGSAKAALADAVDFGVAPASNQMIVYWSGAADAPALQQIRREAAADGLGVLVAPRKVSRDRLAVATSYLETHLTAFANRGIALSGFGGFSADFDGVQVYIDANKSRVKDIGVIKSTLEAELGVPVNAQYGVAQTLSGKYNDSSPYNGGGIMLGAGGSFCTTGFGVIYGASVYRYISARHCNDGPYHAPSGASMGGQQLVGTGYNGAAVFSAAGSDLVFGGSNVGNPTNVRYLTQQDPGMSTVGTVVCQEGANMGQRCGTIRQIAVEFNDGFGIIRANYVTSTDGSIIAASGDSGASVISLHTQDRAWAAGILQAGIMNANGGSGTECPDRYPNGNICTDNFLFSSVAYALSGFSGYGINYF